MNSPHIRPFSDILVLDLTHVLAGPFCTYQLALLGADVIKIEPPGRPDAVRGRGPDAELNAKGLGINFQAQGGNKRAITLDLAQPAGREVFFRLLETADVLVENYRTGALAALGLDDATLAARRPALIHCSLTGFGQQGPRAEVNAYDNVIQATSGLMAGTGNASTGPVKTGASVIDYASGLNAAFAIAAALYQRQATGRGQRIDCAMFDTALQLMGPELAAALSVPPPHPVRREAGLGCYQTADGLLMLGAFNPRQNRRVWEAFGRPDLAALEDWEALWANAEAMRSDLADRLRARSAAEWAAWFHEHGVPAERVRPLTEAVHDPQLAHRPLLRTTAASGARPVTVPTAGFTYAHGGPALDRPPPRMGEHTREILAGLGYSAAAIAAMAESGVI